MNPPNNFDRRDFIKGAIAATAVAGAAGAAQVSADEPKSPPRQPDLIRKENAKEGSLDWQLTRLRLDASSIRSPWVEGYCSKQSVAAGETLDVMVSLDPPGKFMLEIFRMGYYGGRGARLMQTLGPLDGKPQPLPEIGEKRLRECRWEPTIQLKIPDDWPSGVYLGRLSRISTSETDAPWQSYVIFIVKDDRPADVLFQCSDNTWQAYNRWPDTYSLYDTDEAPWALVPGVDVSFDRPYGKYRQIYDNPQSVGSGDFLCWEFPLCYFLEKHGYDVAYCSNSDMLTPERGLKCKTFISHGHDEYWDERQYHSVKRMIDEGVNALFLCGNSVCFVSPFRDAHDGRPNRIITRAGCFGGMTDAELKTMPAMKKIAPDESLIIGARTIIPFNGGGDWIVSKPEHWLFAGTGMKAGERIPGLVGWEFHGEPAEIEGLEVVAEGIALAGGEKPAHWTATVYPGPKGNFVFNAATIFWAQGLASPPGHMLPWSHWTRPHGPDERVQRITHNALRRALG
jgi:hypothetical protein